MWKGFGDGLAQAFEMAVVPVLFALVGLVLDRWIGVTPALTLTLAVLGLIGVFARAYYWYIAQAEQAEQGKPWARRTR